jgi:hypothetical protein
MFDGDRTKVAWRIGVLSTMALGFAECVDELPARRAPFAFHYAQQLSEEELSWYSQFELLVTHDPLPREQVDRLHAAGTKVLFYEWSVAFYEARATGWQKTLLAGDRDGVLNATPLTGGAGSETSGAWYFDPAIAGHRSGRAAEIARRLADTAYDGIFLDTTTIDNVHPRARAEYERRHPDEPYDAAFARFLQQLRKAAPKAIVFTNQGYRKAEHYLPWADWDLTESLITTPSGVRPWNDPDDPWNSIHFVMKTMVEPIARRYPHVRLGHLNYLDVSDRASIRLVVAVAQLFDGEGFAASSSLVDEVDTIYFRDPGKPLGPRVDAEDGQTSHRFFEHGLVVVTASPQMVAIANDRRMRLRNRETGEIVCGAEIRIPAAPAVRAWFFDKVSTCVTPPDTAR